MRPRLFLLVLAHFSAPAMSMEAQQGSIGGVVLAEASRAPLADAEVRVVGTDQRTTTDAAGRFTLTGISLTEVTVQVRRVGYRPVTLTAPVGQADLRILLAEKVVDLDAVVVSGTADGSARRELGNAVSTIDAAQIRELGTTRSLQELLNARAPSVNILPASGNVGTGSRIRVRGASSLSLSNQPLLYVDGVRVNNAVATGPVNQAFGSASISRLNDINPEDIESIEILKGPAAATLYGTEASNGVIQVITKRPAAGAARWNLIVRQGTNFFANPGGRLWTNYQIDTLSSSPTFGDTVSFNPVEHEAAVNQPIWRNGALREYDLSVAGGTAQSRYYLAGGYELNEGADLSNSVRRYSTRANGQVTPNENLSVGLNLGYVTGRTRLPCEAGCGGRVWT
ncbi:MAG: TonB-dependent receptor plug domain-containing protein, partial [Gemmatimonadales bacterium]